MTVRGRTIRVLATGVVKLWVMKSGIEVELGPFTPPAEGITITVR